MCCRPDKMDGCIEIEAYTERRHIAKKKKEYHVVPNAS